MNKTENVEKNQNMLVRFLREILIEMKIPEYFEKSKYLGQNAQKADEKPTI